MAETDIQVSGAAPPWTSFSSGHVQTGLLAAGAAYAFLEIDRVSQRDLGESILGEH